MDRKVNIFGQQSIHGQESIYMDRKGYTYIICMDRKVYINRKGYTKIIYMDGKYIWIGKDIHI